MTAVMREATTQCTLGRDRGDRHGWREPVGPRPQLQYTQRDSEHVHTHPCTQTADQETHTVRRGTLHRGGIMAANVRGRVAV
jgi:hypothetical protein